MNFFDRKRNVYDEDEPTPAPVGGSPAQPTVRAASVQTMLKMKMIKPTSFAECPDIADSLKAGHTVVLNLDALPDDQGRRMLDYVAGVIYTLGGKIERPSERTFLLTPMGVSIDTHTR